MNSNWTNRTRPSLLVSPASGKASPNMNHGVIRVTSQAPPMQWATPEQREAVVVGVQKQLSDLDCAPQLTRHPWQLHAALHQQQQPMPPPAPPPAPPPVPPPAPPLPPFGPTTTRLIKVVTRQTSHWSSFSQLDGQDNRVILILTKFGILISTWFQIVPFGLRFSKQFLFLMYDPSFCCP